MELKEAQRFMKAARVRAGYSQEKIAEILGVARNTVVYYEKKPGSLPLECFVILSDLYGEDFTNTFIAEKLYHKYN